MLTAKVDVMLYYTNIYCQERRWLKLWPEVAAVDLLCLQIGYKKEKMYDLFSKLEKIDF